MPLTLTSDFMCVPARIGHAYLFQITCDQPCTFAIAFGALPAGLSMDSAGLITGTPTSALELASFYVVCTSTTTSDVITSWMYIAVEDSWTPVSGGALPESSHPMNTAYGQCETFHWKSATPAATNLYLRFDWRCWLWQWGNETVETSIALCIRDSAGNYTPWFRGGELADRILHLPGDEIHVIAIGDTRSWGYKILDASETDPGYLTISNPHGSDSALHWIDDDDYPMPEVALSRDQRIAQLMPAVVDQVWRPSAYQFRCFNGTAPYTWSVVGTNSRIPPGMGLNSDGTFNGAPTVAGEYQFTVQVQDANGLLGRKTFALRVWFPSTVGSHLHNVYAVPFIANDKLSLALYHTFDVTHSETRSGVDIAKSATEGAEWSLASRDTPTQTPVDVAIGITEFTGTVPVWDRSAGALVNAQPRKAVYAFQYQDSGGAFGDVVDYQRMVYDFATESWGSIETSPSQHYQLSATNKGETFEGSHSVGCWLPGGESSGFLMARNNPANPGSPTTQPANILDFLEISDDGATWTWTALDIDWTNAGDNKKPWFLGTSSDKHVHAVWACVATGSVPINKIRYAYRNATGTWSSYIDRTVPGQTITVGRGYIDEVAGELIIPISYIVSGSAPYILAIYRIALDSGTVTLTQVGNEYEDSMMKMSPCQLLRVADEYLLPAFGKLGGDDPMGAAQCIWLFRRSAFAGSTVPWTRELLVPAAKWYPHLGSSTTYPQVTFGALHLDMNDGMRVFVDVLYASDDAPYTRTDTVCYFLPQGSMKAGERLAYMY